MQGAGAASQESPGKDRAVAEREAADRFLANELAVLRIMAMSSDSPQGGPAMAEKGRALLSQIGLLN